MTSEVGASQELYLPHQNIVSRVSDVVFNDATSHFMIYNKRDMSMVEIPSDRCTLHPLTKGHSVDDRGEKVHAALHVTSRCSYLERCNRRQSKLCKSLLANSRYCTENHFDLATIETFTLTLKD
jgi:hypothetical protein